MNTPSTSASSTSAAAALASSNGWSLNPIRSAHDIRNYFTSPNPDVQAVQQALRRPAQALPPGTSSGGRSIPPWVSSFQGTLTPIQTRSRSSSRRTPSQDEIESSFSSQYVDFFIFFLQFHEIFASVILKCMQLFK